MSYILAILISFSVVSVTYAGAVSLANYYVSSNKLNVRLAANKNGKITNTLYKRQKVEVFEVKDGWARISRFYDGEVEGIQGKVVARWVFAKYLSTNRPTNKIISNNNSPVAQAIKASDEFSQYQDIFVSITEKLVSRGSCTLEEFKEQGGWMRSPKYKPAPVYFIYCGGMTRSNRIYINAETGAIFR